MNVLYDLENRIYLNAVIQHGRYTNKDRTLIDMIRRSPLGTQTILIADNRYESYNIFAHAQEKGCKYLIRIKDIGSRGIITKLPLPDTEEFDFSHTLILTKKQTKEIKARPEKYRFLSNKSICDFLDPKTNPFYSLYVRIVGFKITDNSYECIITNLSEKEFTTADLKSYMVYAGE